MIKYLHTVEIQPSSSVVLVQCVRKDSTWNSILFLSVIRTHLKQPGCSRHGFSAAQNANGEQEVILYSRSRLTNSHYSDVFALFAVAPLTQMRNQQEFFIECPSLLFLKEGKMQEADQKMLGRIAFQPLFAVRRNRVV